MDDLRYILSLLDLHMVWDEETKTWRDSRVAKEPVVHKPINKVFGSHKSGGFIRRKVIC